MPCVESAGVVAGRGGGPVPGVRVAVGVRRLPDSVPRRWRGDGAALLQGDSLSGKTCSRRVRFSGPVAKQPVSLDMRPCHPPHDLADIIAAGTEVIRYRLPGLAPSTATADFKHIIGRYFCVPVRFAARRHFRVLSMPVPVARSTSCSRLHVIRVVLFRAQSEMRWVAARWVVAGMQHEHRVVRNRSVRQFPCAPRRDGPSIPWRIVNARTSVPSTVQRTLPGPTRGWRADQDVGPKVFGRTAVVDSWHSDRSTLL